jgi:CRP/FNR family cyclic AMP-dependent transcriptional regulator
MTEAQGRTILTLVETPMSVDAGPTERAASGGCEEGCVTLTKDRRTELLGACPLFGGVTGDDLAAIAERSIEVDFPADHVIARQGEIGTGFFVVVEGVVRVVRDGQELARLGRGEFFGELSVIDGLPRVAQVVTTSETRCLALATWEFERLILDHPTIGLAILRGLSARLRSKTEQSQH